MYGLIMLVYLCFVLIAVIVALTLSYTACAIFSKMIKKNRFKKKTVFLCLKKLGICLAIGLFGVLVSDMFLAYSRETKEENLVTDVLEVILNDTEFEIDPWNNKNIEEEQDGTYLDNLFEEKLRFSDGSKLMEEFEGVELMEEYKLLLDDWIRYEPPLPLDLLKSLKPEQRFFIGNEIRMLEEIDQDVKKYKSKNVPIDIYIEEFYARIGIALENGSEENIYQIARAADDIVYILEEKPESIYMFMFFATCSIDFYLESLSNDDIKETKADIYLKCGVILEKVKKQLKGISEGNCISSEQELHLQLLINAFYEKAYVEMGMGDNWCQGYLAYYYGINLYDVGKACRINDADHYEKALILLMEYVEKNDGNTKNIDSCKSYISRIISENKEIVDAYNIEM